MTHTAPTAAPPLAARLAFGLVLALSLFIAAVSLRYALPGFQAPPSLAANRFADPMLLIHAISASAALLIGPLQFFRRRRTGARAGWHRLTGVLYVLACLAATPSGLALAIGTTAGPVAAAGFALLALVWAWTTARGVQALMAGRYAEHGRWMVRSFSLTFAAVMLRLYLPALIAAGVPFEQCYPVIAWACWVPNLLVAEALLMKRRRGGASPSIAGPSKMGG